ncbi:hypothetical protein COLO4_11349 [Corchorus olitorius]|uniref:Uncharacterized protein n=1 Tax=Corchorus olitorius TaxID=93759 RepID=A0A1R3K4S7_9ROSI|nr:hypothetical protein COLO4_11349 [Corchorus olitorius]
MAGQDMTSNDFFRRGTKAMVYATIAGKFPRKLHTQGCGPRGRFKM